MKKSISQTVFAFKQLPDKKNTSAIKKVEGFDTQATTSKSKLFTSKVNNLKNRPKQQSLEDQYVHGLQDQIHYLEMQLKLLKQKEIAKHSQVDQLETFFGDGIPINENILGMKNQYNNLMTEATKKIKFLEHEVIERQNLLESLKTKNNGISENISKVEETYKLQLQTQTQSKKDLIKTSQKLKKQLTSLQQQLRSSKMHTRKYQQKINNLTRNKEISMIVAIKYNTHKYSNLHKLQQQIKQSEKQFQKQVNTYQQMKKQQQNQQYVMKIEEDNLRMKKKRIVMEKQYHALIEKINDKKIELEIKLKERLKEINGRMDVEGRLEKMKENIDRENGLSVEELEAIAKQREIKELENIVENNRKLAQYLEHYSDLLSKKQESIQELGVRRPDLKKQIQAYQNQIKHFEQQKIRQSNRQHELYGDLASTQSAKQHYKTVIPELTQKNSKNTQKIKILKHERQRILQDIQPRQKQLQLIQILKSLNLEEVQLCNASNMDVQQILVDLMRNWEVLSKK